MNGKRIWPTPCMVYINGNISMPCAGAIELKDNMVRIITNGREAKCRLSVLIYLRKKVNKPGETVQVCDVETGYEIRLTHGFPGLECDATTISMGKPTSETLIIAKADEFDKWLVKRGKINGKQT